MNIIHAKVFHLRIFSSLLLAVLAFATSARAQTGDWTGATSSNLSVTTNWNPTSTVNSTFTGNFNSSTYSTAPNTTAPTTAFGKLYIGSSSGALTFATSTNNITLSGVSQVGIEVASGAGAVNTSTTKFRLAGNQAWLNNSSNGVTIGGTITNNASTAPVTLTIDGTGNTTLSGIISNNTVNGQTSLTKNGTGTLTLSTAANTFTGGLTIKSGTVNGTVAASFGAGAIVLGDTTGSNNATIASTLSGTHTNNITITAGTSGTLSILGGTNSTTFNGTVALNNNLTLDNITSAKTLTFSGAITQGSNATTITKGSGAGNVTISGATTLGAGGFTLANSGAALFTHSGGITGTGNLTLKNNSTFDSGITVNGTINHNGTITNSGSGSGSVTLVTGAVIGTNVTGITQNSSMSALRFQTGNNTFNGSVTINTGTVIAQSIGSLGAGSTLYFGGGASGNGTLVILRGAGSAAALTANLDVTGGNGTIISDYTAVSAGQTNSLINASLGGGYQLSVRGGGNLTSGTSTFSAAGPVTLIGNAAFAVLDNLSGNATAAAFSTANGTTGTGNLTLRNNSTNSSSSITFSTASVNHNGTITNSGSGTGSVLISSAIGTNVTGVTQNSSSSNLTLSGNNTYTGNVTVNSGTLLLSGNGTLGAGSSDITISGGTLNLGGRTVPVGAVNMTGGTLTNGSILSNGSTYNFQDSSVSANLTGSSRLVLNGNVTLSGNNTFSGGTTISGGIIAVSGNRTLGSGEVNFNAGTLNYTSASSMSIASNSNITTDSTYNISNGTVIVSGTISGPGAVIKSGAGNLTLSGNNSYTGGTTITNANLIMGADNALGNGALTLNGTGTTVRLSLNGTNQTITSLALGSNTTVIQNEGSVGSAGSITFNLADGATSNSTSNFVLRNGTGTLALVKTGNGTLDFSTYNTMSYSGGLSVNEGTFVFGGGSLTNTAALGTGNITLGGGTIQINPSAQANGNGTATLANLGNLTVSRNVTLAANTTSTIDTGSVNGNYTGTTWNGTISGAGNLTKSGNNSLTLTRNNTFTGATIINAGSLVLGSSGNLLTTREIDIYPNASFVISSNASFGNQSVTQKISGGGLFIANNRTVTIGANGTLAPDDLGSNLTFDLGATGKLAFANNSTIALYLDNSTTSRYISFNGSAGNYLLTTGKPVLALTTGNFSYNATYTVFDNVNTANFSVSDVTGYDSGNYTYNFSQNGSKYELGFRSNTKIKSDPTATSITFGQSLANSTLSGGNATKPGNFTWSNSTIIPPAAGVYTGNVTFTPDDLDFAYAYTTVNVTVKAIPTISWDFPSKIIYGTALSNDQLNASASVNGNWTYSLAKGTTLDAGIHTLTANFTPSDSGNYTNATASKNLTVNKATPTISITPNSDTKRAGNSYPLTISASMGNPTLNCSSSNTSLAAISNNTLTTNSTGNASLTVTLVSNSASTETAEIRISANETANYFAANATHLVTIPRRLVTPNQTFNSAVGVYSQFKIAGAATSYNWNGSNSTVFTSTNGTGNLTLNLTSNGVITCKPGNAGNFTAPVTGALAGENGTTTANLTFYIAKGDQIITGVSPIQTKVQGATYTINPLIVRNGNITSSSSNFTSSNYTTANLSALNGTSTTVNATATGSANITISQNATVDYNSANFTQSLTIIDRPSVTSQIFNGTINIPFSAFISGNNTDSATTFATTSNLTGNRTNGLGVTTGNLTTIGLTLNPLTGAITGTPTLAGNFSINATATRDGMSGAAGNLTFRISPMIAGWDFQTTKKSPVPFIQAVMSPSTYAANFGSANGTMYFNGLNGSSRWVYSNGTIFVGSGANSTTNGAEGFSEVFGSPAALKLVSSSISQNASIVFSCDSSANKTFTLSYAYVNTAGGFGNHALEWTHNSSNATWTSLGNRTFPKLANATYTTANFSTSNFTSANATANGTIFFRLTLSNGNTTVTASPNSPNFTIIDNVQIGLDSANAIAVAPPVVNPQTFVGMNGTAFSATINATNSPTSYAFIGMLPFPSGLTLNSTTGVISGNLTQAGNFTISVNATNSGGTGSGNLTFNILDSLLSVTEATFSAPRGVLISSTSSYRVIATGSPLGYSISGGSFPPGLFLNPSNGQISGTPTTKGTFIFYVKARNAAGLSNAAKITFTVN